MSNSGARLERPWHLECVTPGVSAWSHRSSIIISIKITTVLQWSEAREALAPGGRHLGGEHSGNESFPGGTILAILTILNLLPSHHLFNPGQSVTTTLSQSVLTITSWTGGGGASAYTEFQDRVQKVNHEYISFLFIFYILYFILFYIIYFIYKR